MGPTAVGKTALAIKLARHFKTEIISSDSRQFFAEMNIGTAKPSIEELNLVPHHFIGNISINQKYSAGYFERDALKKLDELFVQYDVVVMVGGSGLYIKALLEGLDKLPDADEELRTQLQHIFDTQGIEPLQAQLKNIAPEKFATIDIQNTQRVMRAIEIALQPKDTVPKEPRSFKTIKIGLNLDRDILYQKINNRVDEMITNSLEDEVKSLLQYKETYALQTVGYSEFFDYFENKNSLLKTTELIKQHTRNFAKRQLTWFKREQDIAWFQPENWNEIINHIEKKSLSFNDKY